ncbi:hypothetical protein PMG11_01204 [Penicillium brasilianum]|uniref:Uncharacterized protein n=1 Tax=Penicillium brasilianum TaxID=104259 RepID=A0A0F7TIR0_PENBI|nr:hypothetical protein PMG11_01204 [Penicillium brasilianum]
MDTERALSSKLYIMDPGSSSLEATHLLHQSSTRLARTFFHSRSSAILLSFNSSISRSTLSPLNQIGDHPSSFYFPFLPNPNLDPWNHFPVIDASFHSLGPWIIHLVCESRTDRRTLFFGSHFPRKRDIISHNGQPVLRS